MKRINESKFYQNYCEREVLTKIEIRILKVKKCRQTSEKDENEAIKDL